MKKFASILGSTGSIGLNALKIFKIKKKLFKINLLAADRNYKLICKQIIELRPKVFLINDKKIYDRIKKKFKKKNIIIINKLESNKKLLKKSDITIAAIPGLAGLEPTIEMIKKTKKILIANKESVICGWNLIKKIAFKNKTQIVPLDSEHFSIMKLLENQNLNNIKKIYLTASGGPFLNYKESKMKNIKPHQALKHPKWKMGKKISIDSATLMNKMLELIEAQKLFSISSEKIEIVIHPESLIHAIIEQKNGLLKFIYHETTMLIPIANAIFDDNVEISEFISRKINSKKSIFFHKLNFNKVDENKFPVIKLKEKLNEYHSSPIIINAANEILVDQFLKKRIAFKDFYKYLILVLKDRNYKKYAIRVPKNTSQIYKIDEWARKTVFDKVKLNKYG